MIQTILTVSLIFILAILQVSFMPLVSFFPYLLLLAVIVVSVFEPPGSSAGIVTAFAAGFFWDVFSSNFLGMGAALMVLIALIINIIKERYVRVSII